MGVGGRCKVSVASGRGGQGGHVPHHWRSVPPQVANHLDYDVIGKFNPNCVLYSVNFGLFKDPLIVYTVDQTTTMNKIIY